MREIKHFQWVYLEQKAPTNASDRPELGQQSPLPPYSCCRTQGSELPVSLYFRILSPSHYASKLSKNLAFSGVYDKPTILPLASVSRRPWMLYQDSALFLPLPRGGVDSLSAISLEIKNLRLCLRMWLNAKVLLLKSCNSFHIVKGKKLQKFSSLLLFILQE